MSKRIHDYIIFDLNKTKKYPKSMNRIGNNVVFHFLLQHHTFDRSACMLDCYC